MMTTVMAMMIDKWMSNNGHESADNSQSRYDRYDDAVIVCHIGDAKVVL
jgi:hypothetical protein